MTSLHGHLRFIKTHRDVIEAIDVINVKHSACLVNKIGMNKVGKFCVLPASSDKDFGIICDKDSNLIGILFDGIQEFLWSDDGKEIREELEIHLDGADDFVVFEDTITRFTLFDVLPRCVQLCVHEGYLSVICDAIDVGSFPLFAETVRLFGGNVMGDDVLYKEWFNYWFHDHTIMEVGNEDLKSAIKSTSPMNSGFSGRMSRVIGDM